MAKKKNQEWLDLCDYIMKEILRYDENMKFPTYLALKLQGLKTGKHLANNKIEDQACYDDYTILCAFKLCKNKILDYLVKNETKIKDERHKINLIVKFVEPEINDVYIRLKQAEKKKASIEDKSFDNQYNEGAGYTKKTKETSNKLKTLFQRGGLLSQKNNKSKTKSPFESELLKAVKKVKDYKVACEANIVSIVFKQPDVLFDYQLSSEDFIENT